ncbi:MAG: hypothetical protein V7682_06075 [Cycloclasticus sp.]
MKIKLIYMVLLTLGLSACADLSMYKQVPAPVGRSGDAATYPSQQTPSTVKTYPMDDATQADDNSAYGDQSNSLPEKQNPAVLALLDRALQQSDQGQLDVAVSKLERAVRIAPRDPVVWHELAKVRLQQNKFDMAISLAKKSNSLIENDKNLQHNNWLLMAKSYERKGDVELARQARINANRPY